MKGYVVVVGRRRFVEKSEVERGRESIARSVVYSPQPNSPFVFDSSHGPSALHHYRGLKQQLIHLIGLPRIVTTSFSCSIYRYPADVVLRKGSQDVCFKHTPYGNSNPHSLHKSQESRVWTHFKRSTKLRQAWKPRRKVIVLPRLYQDLFRRRLPNP